MGQDPDAIRQEIEETRDRMGDTVDAIGYKADVKSRAKENVSDKVDSVKGKLGMATDKVSSAGGSISDKVSSAGGTISDRTPDRDQVKQAAGVAQENPLGLAVGGVALGFLAGMLIPETQKEHEKLGDMADRVKEQAAATGREAVERGKDVAQSAAQSATDTVKEEGRQQGEGLASSAKDSAQQVRP